jgi:hypothetical protein
VLAVGAGICFLALGKLTLAIWDDHRISDRLLSATILTFLISYLSLAIRDRVCDVDSDSES